LVGFLIASYRTICRELKPFSSLASLTLALWTVMTFYNVTEAAFKGDLLWLTFLLGAIAVPRYASSRVRSSTSFDNAGVADQVPSFSFEMNGHGREPWVRSSGF